MSNRPRNTETKRSKWVPVGASKYPNIEEYRTRNREYRAKKRQELAEQIANRITPVNCETIIELADEIRELADNIQYYRKLDIEVQYLTIIELQNHIHELQSYLVRLEETAIGMHD